MKTLGELTEITIKPESSRRHSRKITAPETPTVNKVRGSRRNKNWQETYHHNLAEPEKGGLTIKLFNMGPLKEELKPLLDIQNRTDDQALAIYHLLWDSKFFTEISSGNGDVINLSGMAHLCKKFKYVTYPSGSVIVNQDEAFSSKVYLILSGCVSIMNKYTTTLQSNEKVHHSRPSIFVNGDSPIGRLSARAQRPSFAVPRRRVSAFSPFSPTNLFEGLKSRKSFRKIIDVSSEDVSRDSSSFGEDDEKTRVFDSGTRPSITEPVEKLVERLLEGDYFGAKCSFKRTHRKLGATASTNVEMLVLDKEDLEYAKNEFNNQKVEILKFLMETFPYFYNEEQKGAYEEILHSADIKLLNYQRKVINEGESGDEFYAIVDGECDLIKTVIYEKEDMLDVKSLYGLNKNAKEEIRISCLQKGTLFGEEILFNDKCPYEYSVRVTSVKARLLAFKKSEFIRRCPADKLEQLKQMFTEKNNRNSRSVHEKLSKKGIQTDSEALKTPKPTIKIPKFRGSYDGTYQNLSPKKSGARSPIDFTDETDYVVPSNFHLQSTALELDSPVGDPPKDNQGYYIPIPNKPAGAQGIVRPLTKQFHSFVSHKMAFSAMNSPLQSKDHSSERKPQGNTSFQGVKDIIMNVTGGLTRSQGFKASTRPPTEIADIEGVRFDFGRTKKPSRIFKSRQESYDGQSSPCFHRNVGLAGLITLKMKEMEQTGEAFRTPKPGKDHMSISERSPGLIKGTNIKHLKMLETSQKLQIEDYRLASSPFEPGSSPKDMNKTTKKGFMKSKIKINKIASHSSTMPRNSELLPNIQVNKFSPNIGGIKARDTRTSKFFMG